MEGVYPPIEVLGVPVPLSHPVFLAVLVIHVLLGSVAVIAGAVAALSRKERGSHPTAGAVYFWSLTGVFSSAVVLTAFRPREDYPLLVLGSAAMLLAVGGRAARRRRRPDGGARTS